jgi:hypothetical protein
VFCNYPFSTFTIVCNQSRCTQTPAPPAAKPAKVAESENPKSSTGAAPKTPAVSPEATEVSKPAGGKKEKVEAPGKEAPEGKPAEVCKVTEFQLGAWLTVVESAGEVSEQSLSK